MNVSLNWLRDFIDWTGSNDELDDLLTRTGIKVESVATRGADFPHVVIAQIHESSQHPNADRLSVCKVDDGSGHPRQIVCGAKNYKVGDKIPLALPGAVLPGNFKIKSGKLRGVESEGMMCSAKELGLAEDAEGLLILPADAPVGKPLSSIYPADAIFELEITPNRSDWLSHVGVAREIAAFSKQSLRWKSPTLPAAAGAGDAVKIESANCAFYTLRRIGNVKVGPSPQWLRQRLEAVGLRAINNIVDITNYVMLELGQPLHAFDAAKVSGGITVRDARDGEKFLALDGREYTLSPRHVVISDDSRALALGGVMGGEESGVTSTTTEILLESAVFNSAAIRRTARALDLHSDSSHRFERGVNPKGVLAASARATELILELAGGVADGNVLVAGAEPALPASVPFNEGRCRMLLGIDLSTEEIAASLNGLGIERESGYDGVATWKIPAHRLDLARDVDLIEEVARVIGMERIQGRILAAPAAPGPADKAYDTIMALRAKLVSLGLSEARTSTLVSEKAKGESAIRLRNPLGEDQSYLRTSLLPGLLAALERNVRHGARTIALFEVGRTFHVEGGEERAHLAFIVSGLESPPSWRGGKTRSLDWHDAKGIVEQLVADSTLTASGARDGCALTAEISAGNSKRGFLAQLAPSAARALGASQPVLVAEIEIDLSQSGELGATREIPRFPATCRDIAVVAPLSLPFASIEKELRAANEKLLESISPFDVFTDPSGEKLPADRKSLAISLTFRASDRTLTNEEVQAACDRLKQRLREKLAVDFRE